nr:PREDICTED: phosphotriesterase-related protein-like [Linepithema humile]
MASLPVESVETVMGAKPLSELGVTLTHEHLASNFFPCYMPSPFKDINPRVTLCNLAVTRQKPLTIFKNTCLYDESGMRSFYYDISDFKMSGGKTIVDTGSYGMRRNFRFLHTICRTTKINVLVGTGFSTTIARDNDYFPKDNTIETLCNVMANDLENGFDWNNVYPHYRPLRYHDQSIKAAFIGEVGSDWPISDFAQRSIAATGRVQEQVRCPVSFTPAFNTDAPAEILRIYQEAGGDVKKAVISHVDCVFNKKTKFFEFLDDTKCYVQFSLFGLTGPSILKVIAMYCQIHSALDVSR